MKWLIILGLLALVAVFVAVRFRRQIQTALYLFKMFRKMREMSAPRAETGKKIEPNRAETDVELVRCTKCAAWIPRNTALKLSKNTFYCSSKCLESAVRV